MLAGNGRTPRPLDDGTILAITVLGQDLVDALDLNDVDMASLRKQFLLFASKFKEGSIRPEEIAEGVQMYFEFPENLPDLSTLRPPTNTRPKGIDESYFVQRVSGKLTMTY